MKAEGSWTYPDAREAMTALWRSGLVECVNISTGGIYFDPIDESPETLDKIKSLLRERKGGIVSDGITQLQDRTQG